MIAPRRSSLRDRRGSSLDRPSRPPTSAFRRIETQRGTSAPKVPRISSLYRSKQGASRQGRDHNVPAFDGEGHLGTIGNHVPEFVRECLKSASGSSLGASELRATYEAWCADHDYEPLSQQKLGAELRGLGFAKWKSCGLIRYRDLQLVA